MGQGAVVMQEANLCLCLGNFLEMTNISREEYNTKWESMSFTTAGGLSPVTSEKRKCRGGESRGVNSQQLFGSNLLVRDWVTMAIFKPQAC